MSKSIAENLFVAMTEGIEVDRSTTIKTSKHTQSPPSRLGIVSE